MRILISFLCLSMIVNACNPSARFKSQNVSTSRESLENNHPPQKTNELEQYIHEWIGTPYKYGGMTKKGVDCSGFSFQVMLNVYHVKIPRTAEDQFYKGPKIREAWLSEGDLVFFKNVRGRGIDHVGVFIGNGRFAHASTSAGVIISDLEEEYYRLRYVGACRYLH